jgi:hypothetical protein
VMPFVPLALRRNKAARDGKDSVVRKLPGN